MVLLSRKDTLPWKLGIIVVLHMIIPFLYLRNSIVIYFIYLGSLTVPLSFFSVVIPLLRTIELREDGVVFSIFQHKRFVSWNRYDVKEVVDFYANNDYYSYTTSRYALLFSRRYKDSKQKGLRFRSIDRLHDYCTFHFLSTFYIRLINDDLRKRRNIMKDDYSRYSGHDDAPLINMAEQVELVPLLLRWGIKIHGLEKLRSKE